MLISEMTEILPTQLPVINQSIMRVNVLLIAFVTNCILIIFYNIFEVQQFFTDKAGYTYKIWDILVD